MSFLVTVPHMTRLVKRVRFALRPAHPWLFHVHARQLIAQVAGIGQWHPVFGGMVKQVVHHVGWFFCVDLDPDTGHLLFSKQDGRMNQDRWQPRLSSKAKVVQIRLLKTYGSKIKQQVAAANDSTNAPCIGATAKSLNESAKDPMSGITYHMLHKPTCVCGGSLEHVTYRKRFSSLREDFAVDWRHRVSYVISCNLCDTVVPQKGSLWTCEDGCRSVLHPASHDICEPCFSKHASLKSGSRSIFLFKWPW